MKLKVNYYQKCISNYYINSINNCSPYPSICNRVTSNGVCLECSNSSYTLQNGQCYFSVLNCFVYEMSTGICQQCISGYYLLTGHCYKLTENCFKTNNKS